MEEFNEINHIINIFYKYSRNGRLFSNKTQRKAVEELIKEFTFEQIQEYSNKCISFLKDLENNYYAPRIDTPLKLQEKMGSLITYLSKQNVNKKSEYRKDFNLNAIGNGNWNKIEEKKEQIPIKRTPNLVVLGEDRLETVIKTKSHEENMKTMREAYEKNKNKTL